MEVRRPLGEIRNRIKYRLIGLGLITAIAYCDLLFKDGKALGATHTIVRQPIVARIARRVGEHKVFNPIHGHFTNFINDRLDRETDRNKIRISAKFISIELRKMQAKRKLRLTS